MVKQQTIKLECLEDCVPSGKISAVTVRKSNFLQRDICAAPSKIPNIFVIPIKENRARSRQKKLLA
jgi:hypothetical protein